jgi:hypothetical protein
MMILPLVIVAIFLICVFTEKSDWDRMKEAEKLPPFTKEEAEQYYKETFKKD